MKELDLSQEPDLGYYFYPPVDDGHPGHPRMDVILTAKPTARHFDPQKVRYVIATGKGIGQLTVHHPWTLGKQYRVRAGRIRLTDRVGKVVEAFSLGGDLTIVCEKTRTICALTSPAPIFPLTRTLDVNMCLTAEMEIVLAEQKANWDPAHPFAYEEHLAAVNPLDLYTCLLDMLRRKGSHLHSGSSELDCDARHFIESEVANLKARDEWPARMCTPRDLLLD